MDPRTTRHDQPKPNISDVLAKLNEIEADPDAQHVWALMADGEPLCPSCLVDNSREVLDSFTWDNPQWHPIGWVAPADVEHDAVCAHCYRKPA